MSFDKLRVTESSVTLSLSKGRFTLSLSKGELIGGDGRG
jgi:hypothetical protein